MSFPLKQVLLLFAAALLLLPAASPGFAQNAGGDAVYRFLLLPGSARTAALGGNHAALPDADAALFLANPAYLNAQNSGNLSLSWLNHISDVNMGVASTAWHYEPVGTIAMGVRFINYGDIRRTSDTGQDLGSFSANDLAFTAGLGRTLAPNLRAGAAASFIHSGYDTFSSSAVAVNAGIYYYWESARLHIGAVVANLGTQLSSFDGRTENLPLDIRLGFNRRLEYVPIRLNLTLHSLDRWEMPLALDEGETPGFSTNLLRHMIFGAEILFSENFQVRLGYDHFTNEDLKVNTRLDTAGFSFGAGIQFRGFVFDFSRSSFSELGGVTRIGIQTWL
ncbi:MAG: type IX secretion system protein PorQ [Candidatus Cyclonatronum sp.]|uniref:type IX secretion system protein PorQ n=1 Tax=Cyclonatronum sp. TaxID=3024185 RepID=UPI0025B86F9B|nr:type IX secretion system protein PorQ [Cyclonatronum sp.]MCC5934542.1 type IX secretion system protein PorQ [Balneolales bacterium]MCH8485471.1 type IX secretion system protein PorQ [Cyclonatronum sp.]